MIRSLLITADKAIRDVVKIGLEQTQNHEVTVVEDNWALETVKSAGFDLVLCESTLSDGRDGVDLLTQIRTYLPEAAFMLITRTRTQSRYLARERQSLGISAFVQIPIEPVDFFRAIGRVSERVGATATI
jgi:CheY-like chemotaxis protein